MEPDLDHFGDKWIELKKKRIQNLLKIASPDEAIYREILLSLGYPKNKVQFLSLAFLLPYSEVRRLKEKEIIEKALLYRAGFTIDKNGLPSNFDFSLKMDRTVWNYNGVRPVNRPERRIEGISCLLEETSSDGLVNFFRRRIENEVIANKYLDDIQKSVARIIAFDGVGIERRLEMFFNIILPFMMVYSEHNARFISYLNKLFNLHPPLSENKTIKEYKRIHDLTKISCKTVKQYFGIIQWMKEKVG